MLHAAHYAVPPSAPCQKCLVSMQSLAYTYTSVNAKTSCSSVYAPDLPSNDAFSITASHSFRFRYGAEAYGEYVDGTASHLLPP